MHLNLRYIEYRSILTNVSFFKKKERKHPNRAEGTLFIRYFFKVTPSKKSFWPSQSTLPCI